MRFSYSASRNGLRETVSGAMWNRASFVRDRQPQNSGNAAEVRILSGRTSPESEN